MGDSEKEEVLIRREKSMCYVNTIHYRVQVRLYQVPTDQEGYAVARYSKEFPLSTQNRKEILRSSSIVKPASNL
jgi:hypothetical protein